MALGDLALGDFAIRWLYPTIYNSLAGLALGDFTLLILRDMDGSVVCGVGAHLFA